MVAGAARWLEWAEGGEDVELTLLELVVVVCELELVDETLLVTRVQGGEAEEGVSVGVAELVGRLLGGVGRLGARVTQRERRAGERAPVGGQRAVVVLGEGAQMQLHLAARAL